MDASLTSVAVVAAVAFLAPLALALTGVGLPAIVLEILLGIAVGPQVLGWATVDEPVRVLGLVGLAFLLFLSGMELDVRRLRGRVLQRAKLEAVGFGVFVPFFFVPTGMKLDVRGLFESGATLMHVPVFLAALLIARAVPALVYRPFAERRDQVLAAGLLQATSLSIPVVAGQIGLSLGLIGQQSDVALVAAGLLSVVVFPLVAVPLLTARAASTPATVSP